MEATKSEIRRISSLTKKGLSQKAIALRLHIRKTKVVVAQRKFRVGVRSAFGKDVREFRKMFGGEYRDVVKSVSMTEKWLGKRVAKLTPEERIMHKEWAKLKKEYRREKFKAIKKGEKLGELSKKLLEDYEEWFVTP